MKTRLSCLRMTFFVLACSAIIAVAASLTCPDKPAAVPEICSLPAKGYLPIEELPDSTVLLPPPPAAGSAALALDDKVSKKSLDLHGTARWEQAKEDADFTCLQAAGAFSSILKVPINVQDTPHLYHLLRLMAADVSNSTKKAKKKYQRPRPFLVNKKPICTPCNENLLKKNGSYPSGHAAVGWAWALILTEIASPEQTDAILARGWAFGESRVVCNVHWQSDVIKGRFMGAAVIARLHDNPMFRADMEAARAELAGIRAKEGLKGAASIAH